MVTAMIPDLISALVSVGLLGLILGFGLALAASRLRVQSDPVVERINRILPQTQCAQCGYPGCRPYAEAIAAGQAEINQCPPGGEAGVRALADLLGREPLALNPENGVQKAPASALIDEQACIGCTLCIQACPVDAILGSAKLMHTVIAAECTGCELCIPPCPVDCITMVAPAPVSGLWRRPRPGWNGLRGVGIASASASTGADAGAA